MQKLVKQFFLSLMLLGIFQSNINAGEIEQRAFIERFYQNILDRTADDGGMNTWLNTIQNESAAKVALAFFKSQEFLNKNLSNEEFVDTLYETLFDRQADLGGRTGWINKLYTGTSKDEVMYGFFNAEEFKVLSNKFGVVPIRPQDQLNTMETNGIEGYVNRFYKLVLNRDADESGFINWTTQLTAGTKGGGDIAKGFFNSDEYLNRGLDNDTFLDISYRAFFDREADAGGKSNWLNKMNQGASKDEILNGFIDSAEFINLAESFGISNRIQNVVNNEILDYNINYFINDLRNKTWFTNMDNDTYMSFKDTSIFYEYEDSRVISYPNDEEPTFNLTFQKIDDTHYGNYVNGILSDTCKILSYKKVNTISNVSIDAIEVKQECTYAEDGTKDYPNTHIGVTKIQANQITNTINPNIISVSTGSAGNTITDSETVDSFGDIIEAGSVIASSINDLKFENNVMSNTGNTEIIINNIIIRMSGTLNSEGETASFTAIVDYKNDYIDINIIGAEQWRESGLGLSTLLPIIIAPDYTSDQSILNVTDLFGSEVSGVINTTITYNTNIGDKSFVVELRL